MSGTISSASSDWLQFYQPSNLSDQPPSTVVSADNTGNIATNSPQLSRVNRTNTRSRRSRASRKTPTTLVNTDTTNFRAMVQQYTGGGGGGGDQTGHAFISGNGSNNQYLGSYNSNNSANLSFGLDPTGPVMEEAPAGGYHLQFRQSLEGGGSGGTGGQQYYQGEQHQGFLQSLQSYTSSRTTTGKDVGPTHGRGSSAGEENNSYVF